MNATLETRGGHDKIKTGSERSFGIVFAVVFAIVGLFPLLHGSEGSGIRAWALIVAAGFLLVAMLRPGLLRPLNMAWHRFGLLLNRVMNPIVMGVLFFAVLAPVGMLRRLFGKNSFPRKPDPEAASYWERPEAGETPSSMSNQF